MHTKNTALLWSSLAILIGANCSSPSESEVLAQLQAEVDQRNAKVQEEHPKAAYVQLKLMHDGSGGVAVVLIYVGKERLRILAPEWRETVGFTFYDKEGEFVRPKGRIIVDSQPERQFEILRLFPGESLAMWIQLSDNLDWIGDISDAEFLTADYQISPWVGRKLGEYNVDLVNATIWSNPVKW